MLLQIGPLLRLGSKCYYGWDFYYAWVQMSLQMGPLLHLGPVIALVPSTTRFRLAAAPVGYIEYMYRIKSHITPPEQYSIHRQSLKVSLSRKGRSTSLLFNLVSSITLLQT